MKERATKDKLKAEAVETYQVRKNDLRFREGILYLETRYFTLPLPIEWQRKKRRNNKR